MTRRPMLPPPSLEALEAGRRLPVTEPRSLAVCPVSGARSDSDRATVPAERTEAA